MLPKHHSGEEPLGVLIAAARRGIKQSTGSRLRGSGLSPQQFFLLMAVAENPGLSLTELCALRRMDPPTASRVMAALSARRLVSIGDDGTDRRRCRLKLTPKGRVLAERLLPLLEELRSTLIRGLSVTEQETLRGLLRRVIDNLASAARTGRAVTEPALEPRDS